MASHIRSAQMLTGTTGQANAEYVGVLAAAAVVVVLVAGLLQSVGPGLDARTRALVCRVVQPDADCGPVEGDRDVVAGAPHAPRVSGTPGPEALFERPPGTPLQLTASRVPATSLTCEEDTGRSDAICLQRSLSGDSSRLVRCTPLRPAPGAASPLWSCTSPDTDPDDLKHMPYPGEGGTCSPTRSTPPSRQRACVGSNGTLYHCTEGQGGFTCESRTVPEGLLDAGSCKDAGASTRVCVIGDAVVRCLDTQDHGQSERLLQHCRTEPRPAVAAAILGGADPRTILSTECGSVLAVAPDASTGTDGEGAVTPEELDATMARLPAAIEGVTGHDVTDQASLDALLGELADLRDALAGSGDPELRQTGEALAAMVPKPDEGGGHGAGREELSRTSAFCMFVVPAAVVLFGGTLLAVLTLTGVVQDQQTITKIGVAAPVLLAAMVLLNNFYNAMSAAGGLDGVRGELVAFVNAAFGNAIQLINSNRAAAEMAMSDFRRELDDYRERLRVLEDARGGG